MFTVNYENRVRSYEQTLGLAKGDIFISGLIMSGVSKHSFQLLQSKLDQGDSVRLLIVNPSWAQEHSRMFTYGESVWEESKESIKRLVKLIGVGLEIRTYSFFMPFIMTGFDHPDKGIITAEVIDYLPDSLSPRVEIHKSSGDNFNIFKDKFEFYWERSLKVFTV